MGTIKSDKEVAQTHATALSTTSEGLSSQISVTKDEMTTVQGNNTAKDLIDNLISVSTEIKSAIQTAGSNLQSVASDFEVVDQAGADSFLN